MRIALLLFISLGVSMNPEEESSRGRKSQRLSRGASLRRDPKPDISLDDQRKSRSLGPIMRRRMDDDRPRNPNRKAIVALGKVSQGRVLDKLLVATWNVDKIQRRKVDSWTSAVLSFAAKENIQDVFIGQQEASVRSSVSNLPENYHSVVHEKLTGRTKDINKSFIEMITSRDV
ncbi:MAG: uncharacterized protein KVP18_003000, partial [Porospora cf. gigantea A]|uniref:uncharacterized protein n=1 Tax=Porospora cf. gigantea A TaxID=2853593 RepID=UPI00355957FE